MTKKFLISVLLLLFLFVLTGCMDIEVNMVLNGDNTGNISMLTAYNTELDEEGSGLDMSTQQEIEEIKDKLQDFEGVEVTNEVVEYKKDEATYKGEKATMTFNDSQDFLKRISNQDSFKLTDLGDGIYRLDVTIDSKSVSMEGMSDIFRLSGGKAEFTFTTDYIVLRHNADSVSGNKLTWDLVDIIFGSADESKAVFIEYATNPDHVSKAKAKRDEMEKNLNLDKMDKDFHGKALESLGILLGSDKGLELDKSLTRAEGAVMYARLLGVTDEIAEFTKSNPLYQTGFNDVPKWAKPTINYLHYKGLIRGVSIEKYGSNDIMTEQQYATLVLRALGYDDANGDFVWSKADLKARALGLYSQDAVSYSQANLSPFIRRGMCYISYNALFFENKNSGELLIDKVK